MKTWAAVAAVLAAGPAAAQEPGRLAERAHQDREIVYFLRDPTRTPSTSTTTTRRRAKGWTTTSTSCAGQHGRNPSARILDTGEVLKPEILKGEAITAAKVDIGEPVRPDSEIVLIRFPPVARGASVRLRISETYTDPARYKADGGELVWDRSFGRPRNAVVLPAGWMLTASSIPATVSETEDGRIRLDFVNPRPDEIAVLIKAERDERTNDSNGNSIGPPSGDLLRLGDDLRGPCFVRVLRPSEEIPLRVPQPQAAQRLCLVLGLDAFPDDGRAHRRAHVQDGLPPPAG